MTIEVFTPAVRKIVIDGTPIEIGPLKARQFAAVQVSLRPIARAISKSPDSLLAEHLPETLALLSAATGADADWLAERDPDALLDLLGEVLSVNADFSRSRIAPAFDRLGQKIAGIAGAAGASSSPVSGGSDTGETTSST